ncbi:MAG TPA: KTSC domain-containing protein [Alphaproteobacteria bacterium]|nr:KTSC domain-containing protein [Alphaproteobacteria bacterium]
MLWERLDSSSLAAVGYDPQSQTLEVEFRTGRTYRYFHVPLSVHQALLAAPSKGRFFVAEIRTRFPHTRIPNLTRGPEDQHGGNTG